MSSTTIAPDDGVDGGIFETDGIADDVLEKESERVVERIAFLHNLARLWKSASMMAIGLVRDRMIPAESNEQPIADTSRWLDHALRNRDELLKLMASIDSFRIAPPRGDHDSMIQFNQQRLIKEALLEQVIETQVTTAEAVRFMSMVTRLDSDEPPDVQEHNREEFLAGIILWHSVMGNVNEAGRHCRTYFELLMDKPILHVPLARGGAPRKVAIVGLRKRTVETLLSWLPHLGLLSETRQLLDAIRSMERKVPVGPGAVTQFDDMFVTGLGAMVRAIVASARRMETASRTGRKKVPPQSDVESELVEALEQLTEKMLFGWLSHSRTLRLSVLEKVADSEPWQELVAFIQRYGEELFTQYFLNLANIRGILHEGTDKWLDLAEENLPEASDWRLFRELGDQIDREKAAEHLTLILEAVAENYSEYREYNSTTTQSDDGKMIYTLLDFLRLRVAYDRVCWNLRPVMLVHEIMVQHERNEAAQIWRRALHERVGDEATRYVQRLKALQDEHAMRMSTIADRIGERFMRTMAVSRMQALVAPAMDEKRPRKSRQAFSILEEEVALLMKEPSGSGLELPTWLSALEDEVDRLLEGGSGLDLTDHPEQILPKRKLKISDFQSEIADW